MEFSGAGFFEDRPKVSLFSASIHFLAVPEIRVFQRSGRIEDFPLK